jgi:hypothetical protein
MTLMMEAVRTSETSVYYNVSKVVSASIARPVKGRRGSIRNFALIYYEFRKVLS